MASLAERIAQAIKGKTEAPVPTPALKAVMDRKTTQGLLDGLKEAAVTVESEVVEDGNRMVVVASWGEQEAQPDKRICLSVRAESIAFIGGGKQYQKLTGEDMSDGTKLEEALVLTLSHPQVLA